MWLTRDKDGTLSIIFGEEKPIRDNDNEMWSTNDAYADVEGDYPLFDNITWNDEPVEIDIIFKKKTKRI